MTFDEYLKETVEIEFDYQPRVLKNIAGLETAYAADFTADVSATLAKDNSIEDIFYDNIKMKFFDEDGEDIKTIELKNIKELEKYVDKNEIKKLHTLTDKYLNKKIEDTL